MASTELSLLDDVLPHYDVCAAYSIQVQASPDQIFQVLQEGIPSGTLTRILLSLRSLPRVLRGKDWDEVEDAFYKLKQLENKELVIGIIGQFWKPVAETVSIHSLEEFLDFHGDGYCKAALNLRIVPKSPKECLLITETRVLGYGEAKSHFRKYWRLVGPFSGIIRREILRKIKLRAEKKG